MPPRESHPSSPKAGAVRPLPERHLLRERDLRLRAMKSLIGNLAHSFNNSLAPLTGYINLLGEEVKKGSPGEHYVGKFDGAVRKAENLIAALVFATHPERHFLPKRTDLSAVLQRTVEAWMKSIPADAQITVDFDRVPCVLTLDDVLFAKVIGHLLDNSLAALLEPGAVTIRLQRQELTSDEAAGLGIVDTSVCCLTIEDSGCGMDAETLGRACEPLFTTRPVGPASGLGLTFVHGSVQLHGGQMDVQSDMDGGTCVRIWLPWN